MNSLLLFKLIKPMSSGLVKFGGNDDIHESEFSIPGFSLFRADRNNGHRGGAVLLLVNNNFCPVEVKFTSSYFDQMWCKVILKSSEERYILVCKRSPDNEFSNSENEKMLCNMLNELYGKTVL